MKLVLKIFCALCIFLSYSAYSKEVKFIFITDVALTTKNAYKLQNTIAEINSYNDIDFVVFGGNNIAKPEINNLNTFLYLLKKVDKKPYVLLGSSDVLSTSGIDKDYYLKRVKRALLGKHSNKTNYTFKKNGYVFIVMDGVKQYFQSTNGYYNKNELSWLDNKLNKHKKDDVIILQHFPILESNSKWQDTAKTQDYYDILSKHSNVKAIISGHYGDNREIKKDGINHILTEKYCDNGAYKIIQMDKNEDFIGTYLVK